MITCLPSRFLARAKSSALSAPLAPVEKPFTPPAWMIMMSLSHSKFCSKCCSQYRSLEPSTTGSLLPSADNLQVHTDPGRGVDSFRSPGHVGDGRSLPRSHGVLLTGQPQDPGRPATRPWGRAIPLPPWAGEGGVARGRPGDCGGRQEEGVGGTL